MQFFKKYVSAHDEKFARIYDKEVKGKSLKVKGLKRETYEV
jgi:hypothetical protein